MDLEFVTFSPGPLGASPGVDLVGLHAGMEVDSAIRKSISKPVNCVSKPKVSE